MSQATTPGPASDTGPALVIVRHGETEWSRTGRHTGRTDVALTDTGELQAAAVGHLIRALLEDAEPAMVLSSPRQRARSTAELAGFKPQQLTEDAAEWDYGDLEGLTTPEISQRYPGWSIWNGPVPGGEDATAVTTRIDRLLDLVRSAAGPVLLFSHGHASRCLAARWLGEPVRAGRQYSLNTGAASSLGYERGNPVILRWNLDNTVVCG